MAARGYEFYLRVLKIKRNKNSIFTAHGDMTLIFRERKNPVISSVSINYNKNL